MAKGTSGRESFGSFGRWLWSSSSVITFPARLAQTCCRCCRCSCCCWCWCCCCDCCCSCECHQIGPVVSKLSIFSHFCLSCMRLLQCCNGFSPVFMRVLSLKNAIQSHLMVLTHIYIHIHTLVQMHAWKVNCLRLCAHTFLYLCLSPTLPLAPLHSFGFGSLQKRATATITRAWPGENCSKDAMPPPPGTNYLLSFGCLAALPANIQPVVGVPPQFMWPPPARPAHGRILF